MTGSVPSFADFAVGDRVYCLAWIGQPFDVVAKDDQRQIIAIETPPGWPTRGQIDIYPETLFLLTHEHWDQIWYWPDRAGERYTEVFERFVASHSVGDVIAGYHVGDGLLAVIAQMQIQLDPQATMMFRIEGIDVRRGEVRVHPVAALVSGGSGTGTGPAVSLCTSPTDSVGDEDWLRCGPTVPLRLEMRLYRWCLSFGELVVSWQDLGVAPHRQASTAAG